MCVGSIYDTGEENNAFDAVLVENVFHHIDNYEDALRELSRILVPGGVLCFVEPRNSLASRTLDYVTFHTPVPRMLRGPWALRQKVMGEEFETGLYPLWLKSHQRFFGLLEQYFHLTWTKKTLFFYVGKAENEKSS